MNLWASDFEVFPNWWFVGLKHVETGEIKRFFPEDISKLKAFIKGKVTCGFNSQNYDNPLMTFILRTNPDCRKVFVKSQSLITKGYRRKVKEETVDVDLMNVGGIQKSLKLCGASLGMPIIQDLPHPWNKDVTEADKEKILFYNEKVDLDTTVRLAKELEAEIKTRVGFMNRGFNVLSETDSGIANVIWKEVFPTYQLRYYENAIPLSDVIFDNIEFQTEYLQEYLEYLKTESVPTNREKITLDLRRVQIGETSYKFAAGGLHSEDESLIFKCAEGMILRDADGTSYYPNTMINYGIIPRHLDSRFTDNLKKETELRVKAKKEGNKIASECGKIIINSTFGKMGDKLHFLYDPLAYLKVTINCQLFLLMLIEQFESNGIKVISANTDGVTCYFDASLEDKYKEICEEWQNKTQHRLEYVDYIDYIRKDVNNYTCSYSDKGEIKYKEKGVFLRKKLVRQGYMFPIVAKCLHEYYYNATPIREYLEKEHHIFEYCAAPSMGDYSPIHLDFNNRSKDNIIQLPHNIRFFISKEGRSIVKCREKDDKIETVQLMKGFKQTILNEFDSETDYKSQLNLDFYEEFINKIIKE